MANYSLCQIELVKHDYFKRIELRWQKHKQVKRILLATSPITLAYLKLTIKVHHNFNQDLVQSERYV